MPKIRPGPRSAGARASNDTTPTAWEGRLRLCIAIDGRNALGPGKVRLLEAIAATKSLSAAAKRLRMSYRAAWKHLRFIEERTDMAVVAPRRGGTGGGGTDLTPEGKALLNAYHNFRREIEQHLQSACSRHFGQWSSRQSVESPSEGSSDIDTSGEGHGYGEDA